MLSFVPQAECSAESQSKKLPYLGASIRSLIDKPGMTILLVNSESPAAKAGIKVGDILIKVNGVEVNNIKDYEKAMEGVKKGEKGIVEITRFGETQTFEIIFQ